MDVGILHAISGNKSSSCFFGWPEPQIRPKNDREGREAPRPIEQAAKSDRNRCKDAGRLRVCLRLASGYLGEGGRICFGGQVARVRKDQHAIFNRCAPDHFLIQLVVLGVPPRALPLFWEQVHHAAHITRREVLDPVAGWHVGILRSQRGCCHGLLVRGHMVEQSADILCCKVCAQSPGGIDIAKGMGHVGNA